MGAGGGSRACRRICCSRGAACPPRGGWRLAGHWARRASVEEGCERSREPGGNDRGRMLCHARDGSDGYDADVHTSVHPPGVRGGGQHELRRAFSALSFITHHLLINHLLIKFSLAAWNAQTSPLVGMLVATPFAFLQTSLFQLLYAVPTVIGMWLLACRRAASVFVCPYRCIEWRTCRLRACCVNNCGPHCAVCGVVSSV